ncbi:MAG: Ig-like domain-containing protein, partial [Clostridiales bacterium]|nr:Ig-like domain-containing protein [Clostridiales bacterium]
LYYYTGGGISEARWAIPGYDIISTTNDIDIYSENDTANFKLVTSSLNVLNAIDYSTGILNLTTQVKNAYLSAQSTSSFTVTTSENTDYVIKNGQIDGIGTVSDDIVVYVGDTDGSTTASGSELTVSLSGLDEAYTVRTDSADSFSMLYENVGLSACCAADGSTIRFDPAGTVSAVMDSAGSCMVSITANEGYSSLEYPTIEISGENVSSLSAQLTDDGNILIEGDDLSEVTINGDMLDGEEAEEMAVSSDEDTLLLCQDENDNLTVCEDTDGDGNYETVIAKTTGDISSFTFTLASDSFVYDGSAKTPAVSVCDESGTVLTEGTDYTVAYTDNVNAGTATVAITGMGVYWGTVTKTFTISKANQTVIASIASSTIAVGETTQITASGEGSITYNSSDSSIAAVSASGAVTGEKAGSATITVTAAGTENFNSESKDLTITVTANDSSVSDDADSNDAASNNSEENASSGTSGSRDNQSSTSGSGGIQSGTSDESTDDSATSVQLAAGKIKKLKNTAKGIVIKWTAVSNASGYYIYRKSGSGSFKKIAAVSGSSTISYTDTSVKSKNGKTYTYKVVPYAGSLEGTGASSVTVRLVDAKLTSVKNTASKKAVVKWSRKAKVTGYQIQYSTSKTFSKNTKKVKVSGAKKVSKTLTKLKKGKTYYVRIRTYKTVNGKTYYSAWSSKKKVKISK